MVGVTNKINYYCCRIFRGAPAPTAPMVLATSHDLFLSDSERSVSGDSASNTCPSCTASEQSSVSQVFIVFIVH